MTTVATEPADATDAVNKPPTDLIPDNDNDMGEGVAATIEDDAVVISVATNCGGSCCWVVDGGARNCGTYEMTGGAGGGVINDDDEFDNCMVMGNRIGVLPAI